ncbi:MAG: hypothetical protein IGR76_10790 [Synechococcales cyanobacterium T60_A2020_003]|nr:hypothetical protein [Synechococcales cyanobacterium T60_A2020_003]
MNWLLLIAALLISFLVFTWLVSVFKATVRAAIAIAVIVLALQLFFGIQFPEVWEQVRSLWERVWRSLPGR